MTTETTETTETDPVAYQAPHHGPWSSPTIGDIAKRIAHAMTLVGTMKMEGHNAYHDYKYFSITQMQAEARKVCGLAGICFFPTVTRAVDETFDNDGKTQVRVLCQITVRWIAAESGEWLESRWIAEALDNGDKAFNKAYTAAIKQSLQKTLLLGGDSDADAESPERGRDVRREQSQPAARQQAARAPSNKQSKQREPARVHQAPKAEEINPDQDTAPAVSIADAWDRLNAILGRYQNAEDFVFCLEKTKPNPAANVLTGYSKRLESLEASNNTQAAIDDFIATTIGPDQDSAPSTQGTL